MIAGAAKLGATTGPAWVVMTLPSHSATLSADIVNFVTICSQTLQPQPSGGIDSDAHAALSLLGMHKCSNSGTNRCKNSGQRKGRWPSLRVRVMLVVAGAHFCFLTWLGTIGGGISRSGVEEFKALGD